MEITLATSKAGHDKGRLYIVLERKEDMCLLSDGKYRPVAKPKLKKAKHLQPIVHLPVAVQEVISGMATPLRDEDIRKILILYENHKES